MPSSDDNVFLIGLTMAGAISAGAYTAGVLDYLFRAIDAHNARVRRGPTEDDPNPPTHRVVVKVMTGASAGSICTGLTLAGLLKNGQPEKGRLGEGFDVDYIDANGDAAQVKAVFEPLFGAWIDHIQMWNGDSETGLLATVDIDENSRLLGEPDGLSQSPERVHSMLDSSHIDDATRAALSDVPPLNAGNSYDFLAADLDIFLTTTDLGGVIYRIDFAQQEFRMAQHASTRHFRVAGLGRDAFPSAWLNFWSDQGIPLEPGATDAQGVVPFVSDPESPWYAMTVSAIASGAFPVGLAPRIISAKASEMGALDDAGQTQGGALPIDIEYHPDQPLPRPVFNEEISSDDATPYVAVDGGVINNEPFEYARFTLRQSSIDEKSRVHRLLDNDRAGHQANRAVIMIDPFPETPEYEPLLKSEMPRLASLLPSALRLFPTLMQQVRFKIDALLLSSQKEIHSRFLIAPMREVHNPADPTSPKVLRGAEAIACGSLGGFGGFLSRDFRLHDFVLGQRNCQSFLQDNFTLHAHNKLLGLDHSHSEGDPIVTNPIVDPGPLGGPALANEVSEPRWPSISAMELRPMATQFQKRLSKIGNRLFEVEGLSVVGKAGLTRLWKGIPLVYPKGLKGDVSVAVAKAVITSLLLRRQQSDFAGFSDMDRYIFATLVSFGDTPQGPEDLKAKIDQDHRYPKGLGERPSVTTLQTLLEGWATAGLVKTRRATLGLFGQKRYRALLS